MMSDMPTIATLFSGGEGVGVGARAAGLRHLWGIEADPDVAQVARDNGFNVLTADVTRCDPHDFESVSLLHASPPCPNFSVAKVGAAEQEEDVALARATAHFIEVLTPTFFTLENVYLYRKSQSWRLIRKTLMGMGYGCKFWHLNSADYGVPQTRKRMIAVARRDGKAPQIPKATHAHLDDLSPMFDEREPWVGWCEAIEDLIPDLPDSEFAPWQLERLPDELKDSLLLSVDHDDSGAKHREIARPSNTVRSVAYKNMPRAFLAEGRAGGDRELQCRDDHAPSMTVTTSSGGNVYRSVMHGRVVQMTPRALARFQSFPDEYVLPASVTLACRVIGNAVSPLLYEKLVRQLTREE